MNPFFLSNQHAIVFFGVVLVGGGVLSSMLASTTSLNNPDRVSPLQSYTFLAPFRLAAETGRLTSRRTGTLLNCFGIWKKRSAAEAKAFVGRIRVGEG